MAGIAQHQPSINQIQVLLNSGDFDNFIGLSESIHFEAKSFLPYQLSGSLHGRLELAKDIAGLGNGGGGLLVCGVETSNPKKIDVVSGLSLGTETDYYQQSDIKNVLDQLIYPKIDFKITWYASSNDKSKGLGCIYVPPQPDKLYFYLVIPRSIYFPREKGHFFAIPVRVGAEGTWLDKVSIKNLTRNQRSNTDQRLDALAESLSDVNFKLDGINQKLTTSKSSKNSHDIDQNLLSTLTAYEQNNS